MNIRGLAAALAAVLLLVLSGCREGELERIRNNERIYALARQDAERLAQEYIARKYGVDAQALGYDVDGWDVFMAYRAIPCAYVALTDGEREFCVYLGLEDPNIRYDNYQREEVAAVLEEYLLSCLDLPAPDYAALEFRVRDVRVNGTVWIDGGAYSGCCMMDFCFDGQSAGELLERMDRLKYSGRFLPLGESMEAAALRPEDWPGDDFSLDVALKQYRSRADCEYYAHDTQLSPGEGPAHYERPGLVDAAVLSLSAEDGEAVVERDYTAYDRAELFGVRLVAWGEAPPPADWAAQWLSFPQETLAWEDGGRRYEAVTPLLSWTAPEGETAWKLACSLPPEFFAQHGDRLYCGTYDPKTGEMDVDYSGSLRPGKPGTFAEGSVYIRQTFTMSQGAWYAVLRPLKEEPTPSPPQTEGSRASGPAPNVR